MSSILVTGGCGYIGLHTIVDLIEAGFDVTCLDSNIRSDERSLRGVQKITGKTIKNNKVDLCDEEAVSHFFNTNSRIEGIIHFAALKSVPESVSDPIAYFNNNINSLLNILREVKKHRIPYFIFSSSCSVYGDTDALPVTEDTKLLQAESPYARTKQICEQIIQDVSRSHTDTKYTLLRYFNPAGAHPSAMIGEIPQPGAYNVVPILIESYKKIRDTFTVTGDQHNTRDGTCIRDYIHVMDLANAHTKCLQYMKKPTHDIPLDIFNVGTGNGVTVLELINAFKETVDQQFTYKIGDRRDGDVSAIYSDFTKARECLGWSPKYTVYDIMESAWKWDQFVDKYHNQ